MHGIRTFIYYLCKDKLVNKLFETLQGFITNQINNLELRLNVVKEIYKAGLSDIDIMLV